jgi:hypothetical protein
MALTWKICREHGGRVLPPDLRADLLGDRLVQRHIVPAIDGVDHALSLQDPEGALDM